VEGKGEAPEMIGVPGFGASGDDGHASFGRGEAFGFVKVFAEERVDWVANGSRFVDLKQAGGEHLRRSGSGEL
jgi:hypothetical protein